MTILITGASRGIGAALAARYQARGDTVIGTTRQGSWPLEVGNPASHAALSAQLDGAPIDLLICNAGVYLDKGHALEEGYPAQAWAETFAANVTGVFLTVQGLLPNLRAAHSPKIAIISSQMASHQRAPGGSYIYRASKAAALNLGRNLSTELAPEGIAVGIYHPGWVRTDMGGDVAPVSVADSAEGLVARFDALDIATTGVFEAFDGQAMPY